MNGMDTILTVNAGSSSVKFEVFAVNCSTGGLDRQLKGQMDGIGTKPSLRAAGANGAYLVDQIFSPKDVADVPAALTAWPSGYVASRPSNPLQWGIASSTADPNTMGRC